MVTWTPKVCRIITFYRFWAIILPTFGGLGKGIWEFETAIEEDMPVRCLKESVRFRDPICSKALRLSGSRSRLGSRRFGACLEDHGT